MNKQALPEVGKRYHFFEDGKSGPSRHYIVEITKIIPFEEITDGELLDTYDTEVDECDFLFAPETDYFVYGRKVLPNNVLDMNDEFIFIRTHDGGWFSFGKFWYDGELDVTGEIYKRVSEWYNKECAPEIGMGTYDEASQTKGLI